MTKRGFCSPTYAVSVRKKSMPPWGTLPDQDMSHNRRLLWSFSEEDTMRKCWSYRYSIWLLVSLSLMNHQKLVHVLITSSLMKSSNTFSCCSFPCFIKQLNLTWGHVSPSSTASCSVLLHFSWWNMLSSSICDRYNTEQCIHAAWDIQSWCSIALDDKISIFPAFIWLPQHWGEHLTIYCQSINM